MNIFRRVLMVFLVAAFLVPGAVQIDRAEDGQALTGKVVETMDSGGYTYAQIEKDGKKTWVAVPSTKITKGQTVSFSPGMEMKNFESKTLKRKFDSIIFSGGVVGAAEKGGEMKSPGSKGSAVASTEKIKVDKAAGPNAYTVSEIFKNSKKLDKKKVVVKGKVVKISTGVMKKNWIHLQDGTGDAKKATNDLVVTSADVPEMGDVVTASGTVATNKDFGSGYKYKVLIEDASIKK